MTHSKKKIYNPDSFESTNDRQIFGGNPTGIINTTDVKYSWALSLWDTMLNNTWFPKEVDMTKDKSCYVNDLTPAEKTAYEKALSQLIFMDSEQTNNLADNINPYITASEINMCLVRMAFEEGNHSHSYGTVIEAISDNPNLIYEMWREDKVLKNKNDYIASLYENLSNNPTDENLILAMVANNILEGIYFYSGFAYIYTLGRAGKMLGSVNMIRFIHRDEKTHLILFQNMINSTRKDKSYLFTDNLNKKIYEMFRTAVDLEIMWGKHITKEGILGLTPDIIEQYIQFLADTRLKAIGLKPMYNTINPIKWINTFSEVNDSKTNFFESKNTNYSKGKIDVNDF